MNTMELIRCRRSVRTFNSTPLSPETAQKILDHAAAADNPYKIPITWKLLSAKEHGLTSPVIAGTDLYIAGKMLRVPHAEEAFGFSFEKAVLFAQSLGVGTTWIGGTMNREAFERAMDLSDEEVMPCVSPLGYPADKMSLRETMMRKGIRADSRLRFRELFYDGSFDRPLDESGAGKLRDALEAVRLTPSAVNKQPWRVVLCGGKAHFYEKRDKGYVSKNGWDIQKIDMGIAICHFDLMMKEAGCDVSLTLSDPGFPVPDGVQYIATCSLQPVLLD